MRISLILLLSMLIASCSHLFEEDASGPHLNSDDSVNYDSTLAIEFGADEYGMKTYIVAFLKAGDNRDQDSTESARLQAAHMANISRLAEVGKLVLAGPFYGNEDESLRGIYVFDVATLDEAKKLTESDPAIQAGRLKMELYKWYGTAALMDVNRIHNLISEKNH